MGDISHWPSHSNMANGRNEHMDPIAHYFVEEVARQFILAFRQ